VVPWGVLGPTLTFVGQELVTLASAFAREPVSRTNRYSTRELVLVAEVFFAGLD
jgi:hypothetical protein